MTMKGGGAASHRKGAHFDDVGYTTHNSKCSAPWGGGGTVSFRTPKPSEHCNPRVQQFENVKSSGQSAGKTKVF